MLIERSSASSVMKPLTAVAIICCIVAAVNAISISEGEPQKANERTRIRRSIEQHSSSEEEDGDEGWMFWKGRSFSWMTTTQKNELTSVGSEVTDVNDARQAALDKVAQYYDDIEQHYVKAKAARSLQTFCKQTMTSYFGPEDIAQLQQLKENNAPKEDLFAKFNELVGQLQNESDRVVIRQYAKFCRKIMHLDD